MRLVVIRGNCSTQSRDDPNSMPCLHGLRLVLFEVKSDDFLAGFQYPRNCAVRRPEGSGNRRLDAVWNQSAFRDRLYLLQTGVGDTHRVSRKLLI